MTQYEHVAICRRMSAVNTPCSQLEMRARARREPPGLWCRLFGAQTVAVNSAVNDPRLPND